MPWRWGIAVALSIAAHLLAVGGIVGVLVLRGLSFDLPVDVEITGTPFEEVHDLPLGPPPGAADPALGRPASKRRHRVPAVPADEGELATRDQAPGRAIDDKAAAEPEPEATPEGAPPRASNLRQFGPEGSRVTVLLRLDRLRDTPYAPVLDALLGRLPDRRDLLEGTGLDLYKSFDALLIATPNPLDYTVTFLAARHRLKDTELRAALDRGAKTTGRVLTWRTEGHRPLAERHARTPAPHATRDERLIILPAPGLVVVTPPIYRALLFATAKPRHGVVTRGVSPAGGDAGTSASLAADAGGGAVVGGGGAGGGAGTDPQWGALLRRIDAEDGIMPANAVVMASAVDIFSASRLRRGLDAVPRSGPLPSDPLGVPPPAQGTILGMEVPRVITVSIGILPSPSLDVVAEFENEEQARHWEAAWPMLHQRMKSNPYVILTGFGALVARAELARVEATIRLHQTATEAETLRLLQLAARLTGGAAGAVPGAAP